MVNLRCPVCAGALEKRAGAYLCPKNHSFDIAKSGYVNLLLNSSQGHHGDDKLMVRARRDFLDKGYYDRFIAAVADAAAEFTPPEATVLDAGCGEGIYSLAVLRAIEKAGKHGELLGVDHLEDRAPVRIEALAGLHALCRLVRAPAGRRRQRRRGAQYLLPFRAGGILRAC